MKKDRIHVFDRAIKRLKHAARLRAFMERGLNLRGVYQTAMF